MYLGESASMSTGIYWQLLFMLPNCWTYITGLVTKVIVVKRKVTLEQLYNNETVEQTEITRCTQEEFTTHIMTHF